MSPPSVQILRATGGVPAPISAIDQVCAFIGVASEDFDAAAAKYGDSETLYTLHGRGPGVRAAGNVIKRTRVPQVFIPVEGTTEGTYGTIDVTGKTGTATVEIDAGSPPLDEYEAVIQVTKAFTVGVAGGKIRWSLDNGRHWSSPVNVGTNLFFEIENSGVRFLFVSMAELNTFINECFTDYEAHRVLTAGSVHGAADNTNAVSAPAATNTATRVARINEICTDYSAHRILTAGAVHGSADSTNALAITTAAVDDMTAFLRALDFKAKYNAHRVLTAGPVHGAADNTNVVSSTLTAGTMAVDDEVSIVTVAPDASDGDITAAFETLADSSLDFSMVLVAGISDSTRTGVVSAGLDALAAKGKRCNALVRSRPQGVGESESDWIAAIDADFASVEDERIGRVDGTAWVDIEEPEGLRTYDTTPDSAIMARFVELERFRSAAEPAMGTLPGVTLTDTLGNLIGHDELVLGGFDEARGMALYRIPDVTRRGGAYLSKPLVLKSAVDRISQWQVGRVINAIERVANGIAIDTLATPASYDAAAGMISVQAAAAVASKIRAPLSTQFANDIGNPNDPDLVQVDRAVTVVGDDVYVAATINVEPFKYVGRITLTINIKVA